MAFKWTNADGLQVPFGNYWNDKYNFVNKPRALSTAGAIKQLVIEYDLSRIAAGTTAYPSDLNNDGVADGFDLDSTYLPANSSVLRVTVVATEAAAGGTSFTVGTYQRSGTAIAATGLVTATEGVLANINAVGKRVYGNGALVASAAGTAGVGAVDAYIAISATGTFTAGKGIILIEYVDPLGDFV